MNDVLMMIHEGGVIGHVWLFRVFSLARSIRGSGHGLGFLGMSTPRYAQTARDLGLAVQFNAETPWHFVQLLLSSGWIVPRVTIGRIPRRNTGNQPEDCGQIREGCSFPK